MHRGRTRLMHMITGNGDAVELGHIGAGISDDVRHDPHRWFGWVNIGIADHELFKNVVLDRPVELGLGNPLLFTRNDKKGEDRNDRAVHRHRYRHLIERNAVEQDFHILNAVNRNASLADIANNARMVTVIATMRGKVEGDRKALLSSGQVAAIKGVGFLGGREARILADRPWAACIHGCAHTTRERRKAGKPGIASILRGIKRLYSNALGRIPGQVLALNLFFSRFFPLVDIRHFIPNFYFVIPNLFRDNAPSPRVILKRVQDDEFLWAFAHPVATNRRR